MNVDSKIHVINTDFNKHSIVKQTINTLNNDDSFYVCDIGDIVIKFKKWMTLLPRVKPFYAVKCNDTKIVLLMLASLGVNFDCASEGEISKILNIGVDQSRIVYANPTKPVSHILNAKSQNVDLMTFDGASELYKIKTHFSNAKLLLRIRYDDEDADVPLGNKYGCDPVLEAPVLLKLAHTLDISVIGIAFHVGTGCTNPLIFYKAIHASRKLFNYVEKELDYKMTILDVGGGFPGELCAKFDKIAYNINMGLDDYFADDSIKIIAEPGRYFVASAFTLVCNVYASRSVTKDAHTQTMYFVNDGMYGSFNGMHYAENQVTPELLKTYTGDVLPSSIWGPTLDSADVLFRNILLPELNIGDWIMFEDMGAYSLTIFSKFNALPKPKVHWFVDQSAINFLKNKYKQSIDILIK